MNSGITAERVYDTLKRRIVDLEFRPGARLDPAQLSETLSSSVTPVREGLNRLRGEGLVETRTGEGFFLPQIDAPALQDLYDWNSEVLLAAVRLANGPIAKLDRNNTPGELTASLADRTADLFSFVASLSSNAEHGRAIAANNDRLRAVRIAEEDVFNDGRVEVERAHATIMSGSLVEIRRVISAYHRRRRSRAADIVRGLYRHQKG